MSLKDVVQRGVDIALGVTDSLLVDITISRQEPLQYNVTEDTMDGAETTFSCRGLEYRLTDYEKTTLYPKVPKAAFDTKKVLISKTDCAFEPDLGDKVIIDNIEYAILSVQTPPTKPMFIMYVARGE
jgi:hypothetical protein